MHGHSVEEFLQDISGFLGCYYLAVALMNAFASYYLWQSGKSITLFKVAGKSITTALVWLVVSMLFTIISPIAMSGDPRLMQLVSLPGAARDMLDSIMSPTWYTLGTTAVLGGMFYFRNLFVKPWVAWSLLNLALLIMGLSMTDPDFAATKRPKA